MIRKNNRNNGPFQESVIKPETDQLIKEVEYRESFAPRKNHSIDEECKIKIQNFLIDKNNNFYNFWKKMDFDKNKFISSNDIKSVLAKSELFNQQNINYILNHFGNSYFYKKK